MTELSRTEKALASLLSSTEEPSGEDSLTQARRAKEQWKQVEELIVVVEKLEKRSKEVDPEKGEFKYNARYRGRVDHVVKQLEELRPKVLERLERTSGVEEAHAARERERKRQEALAEEARQKEAARIEAEEEQRRREEERERRHQEDLNKQQRLEEAGRKVVLAQQTEEDKIFAKDKVVISKFMKSRAPSLSILLEALELMKGYGSIDSSASQKYHTALSHIQKMFARIVQHPESEDCRTINAMNESFRNTIASVPGALQVLSAAGFELRFIVNEVEEGIEEKLVRYVLPEPNLEQDMDKWMDWFEFIKAVNEHLQEA